MSLHLCKRISVLPFCWVISFSTFSNEKNLSYETNIVPGKYKYELVMNKDNSVCDYIVNIYNNDMKKYGIEKYEGHDVFNSIIWKNIKYSHGLDEKKTYAYGKAAELDINNDGNLDFVIKLTQSLYRKETDYVYIYVNKKYPDSLTVEDFRKLHNKITPMRYKLNEPFNLVIDKLSGNAKTNGSTGTVILQPFIYNGVTYISFRGFHEFEPEHWKKYLVIAQYNKGHLVSRGDQTGVMSDVCYLERVSNN